MFTKHTQIKLFSTLFFSIFILVSSQDVYSQWNAMGSGFNGPVRAVAVVGDKLFAAGSFTMSGSTTVNHVAQWNGTAWIALGASVTKGVNDSVNALISFNGELYVGGAFTSAGGVSNTGYLAKWNPTTSTWSSVGTFNNTVRCFYTYKGSLIATGHFTTPKNIAKYVSGTNWVALGSTNPGGVAYAMTLHLGQLYIGGYWGDPSVQYLDTLTNQWVSLASGLSGEVRALASYKKQNQVQLYIGGDISTATTNMLCAYDTSKNYNYPANPFSALYGEVNCLLTTPGYIYAGGGFRVSPLGTDIDKLARYNGGNWVWETFGDDFDNFNDELLAFCNYNGNLIAGGRFTNFGSTVVNYISRTTLVSSIDELNDNLVSSNFYPNPMQDKAWLQIETKDKLNKPVLKIYDLIGKEMEVKVQQALELTTNQVQFNIDGSHLSPGIYYYSVMDKGAVIASGKIVHTW